MQPLVSIITVNYNQASLTLDLLDSIDKLPYKNLEIIVVDNASVENPAPAIAQKYPHIKVLHSPVNLGFAGGNNVGIAAATGEYYFLVNNDAELTPGCIETLLARFQEQPGLGAVSPKICYFKPDNDGDRVIQYAGMTPVHPLTGRNRLVGNREKDRAQFRQAGPTAYAHGAAMMVKRQAVEEAGLMPEDFFLYYEELDWSARIRRAGYDIWVEPNALVLHKASATTGSLTGLKTYYLFRNRVLFMQRNYSPAVFALFMLYFLLVSIPKNALQLGLKGEKEQLKALFRSILPQKANSVFRVKLPKTGVPVPNY